MSRLGEHTPLSPNKGERDVTEKGRDSSSKQPPSNEDQRPEEHCDHNQVTAVHARTPGLQQDGRQESRASEFSPSRSDYGSVATVTVCQSCHHLYTGSREVVLSPSLLEAGPPRPSPANPKNITVLRQWATRRYEGLCDCSASVTGGVCVCPGRINDGTLRGLLSHNAACVRKMKVAALVLAAILPWVFLVTYIVLSTRC